MVSSPGMASLLNAIASVTVKAIISVLVLIIGIIIYRLYFHSLSNIPGPRLAGFSNIWHAYHARNGRMLKLGKDLHKQYGRMVRVGPNEVWLDSKEAFLKIYSATQGYPKSSFYVALALNRPSVTPCLGLSFPDTLDLLGEFDLDRYRLQRRLIGPLYQTRSLLKHEKSIDEVLLHAIARLKGLNGAPVDLKEWMHIITVECLTAVVLSWSPGYLKAGTDHGVGPHAYLGWRRKSVFGLFPWAEVMDAYSRTLGRTFAKGWRLTYQPPAHYKALFPLLGTKVSKRINAALRPIPPKDGRNDLTAELIQLHKEKPEFSKDYLKRMVMTNFGAGHETTTSTLISVLTMLGLHAEAQGRVAAEISNTPRESQSVSYAEATDLTYTQAAIKESQRLHPVIGMSLSRRVPPAGLQVHGQYFPPGTTVGCNPISLHRNPEIFGPDAELFNPERWLHSSRVQDMERCNLLWGAGQRTCPGQALAKLIVFKVVATLVRHFKVEVEVPPEEEMKIYFMAMLTGVKVCFLEREQ
ncbi:unnamed protein product [Zymoseptoria tritici ST99CH_1E4]|uniref:Cytochrome P450 n=1 Tax=Zymoseptoria tritici ST99CH_1E4 TaxID=1276532 RepID=A0A2H1GP18_ZYMTR|nr:unnamed protein product [Zymoseptoria tritici ST99CH_1E4]